MEKEPHLSYYFNFNFLKCQICYEVYSEAVFKPLIMACGHTICEICINEILKNNRIQCPFDNRVHTQYKSTKDIPVNYAVLDAIVSVKDDAQIKTRTMCKTHKGEVERFYCCDDKILLCPVCFMEDHVGHKICSIEEVKIIQPMREKAEGVKTKMNDLYKLINGYRTSFDTEYSVFDLYLEELKKGLITLTIEDIENQFSNFKAAFKRKVGVKKEEYDAQHTEIEALIEFNKTLLERLSVSNPYKNLKITDLTSFEKLLNENEERVEIISGRVKEADLKYVNKWEDGNISLNKSDDIFIYDIKIMIDNLLRNFHEQCSKIKENCKNSWIKHRKEFSCKAKTNNNSERANRKKEENPKKKYLKNRDESSNFNHADNSSDLMVGSDNLSENYPSEGSLSEAEDGGNEEIKKFKTILEKVTHETAETEAQPIIDLIYNNRENAQLYINGFLTAVEYSDYEKIEALTKMTEIIYHSKELDVGKGKKKKKENVFRGTFSEILGKRLEIVSRKSEETLSNFEKRRKNIFKYCILLKYAGVLKNGMINLHVNKLMNNIYKNIWKHLMDSDSELDQDPITSFIIIEDCLSEQDFGNQILGKSLSGRDKSLIEIFIDNVEKYKNGIKFKKVNIPNEIIIDYATFKNISHTLRTLLKPA